MTRKQPKKQPGPRKSRKSTNAEIAQRVNEVYKKIIQRSTRAEILQYVSETWQVTGRTADSYISRANALLKKQAAYDRDTELVLAVELMKFVIRKTLNVMDYQRTISAQREINSLLGLNAPQKSETKVVVSFEDDAVDRIRAGELTRDTALELFDHDEQLVQRLFAKAALPISVSKAD